MNLLILVDCLNKSEKEELFNRLKRDLESENDGETLREFVDRKINDCENLNPLIFRLNNALKRGERYYAHILLKSVSKIEKKDLLQFKDIGETVWKEFVKLRGY